MPIGYYEGQNNWTEEQIKFLKKNYGKIPNKELREKLNRSQHAISTKLSRLHIKLDRKTYLKRKRENTRKWTKEEDKRLRRLYKTHTQREIAEIMHKTKCSIVGRVHVLGLKLPKREREKRIRENRFQKGMIPWNEGKTGTHFGKDTEFKKGNIPANTKYNGAISFRKDHTNRGGQLEKWIRIKMGKWILYKKYIWEKKYGKIPKGKILRFKDGANHLSFTIKDIELIDRAKNLKLNRPENILNSDQWILNAITRDKELQKEIKKYHPEMIKVRREQLKIRRETKNGTASK